MPGKVSQQRVLATIVFTDVVGYSARMQGAERRTLALVRRDLAVVAAECERCGGTVVKNTGDGVLMHFSTAGRAVECALRVQAAFARVAKGLPPQDVLQHRIGIHLGDVFLTEGDAVGDGVNIAARLLEQAEPGGVCLSQTVYDVVKNRLGVKATYLGPRELKNIAEAVPVYQIVLDAAAKVTGGRASPVPRPAPRPWPRIAAAGLGLAIAAAIVLVVWRHAPRPVARADSTPPTGATPRAVAASAVVPASIPATTSSVPDPPKILRPYARAVHLLTLIDPERDAVAGNWRRVQGSIIGSGNAFARARLPYEPPAEYDLAVEFIMPRPAHVVMILTHHGRSFAWHMGDAENTAAGFELVAGGKAVLNKTTVRSDPYLKPGQRHRAVVQVRNGYVAAYLDDVLQTSYVTDYSDLDLPPSWSLGEPSLGLGCSLPTRFIQIQVFDITGTGKLPKRDKPATRPAT